MEIIKSTPSQNQTCALEAEKAFDHAEWDYPFNFGSRFESICMVRILYYLSLAYVQPSHTGLPESLSLFSLPIFGSPSSSN